MNILLLGASGNIGARVLAEAASRGHNVTAASRNPEKITGGKGITAIKLDATDAAAVAEAAKGADVIISAVSPRGVDDRAAKAHAVADAVMGAAKKTGARLFQVGGAASLTTPEGGSVLDLLPAEYHPEPKAMKEVFARLKASDLNWTFFSPAFVIRPGERTGKFQVGTTTLLRDAEGKSEISYDDYAVAVVDELEHPKHERSQMTVAY
jgi:uncharacterized protein